MVVKAKVSETYCVQLFPTPWTTQSMELSRPEYQSGQPFPSPGNLPNPGIKPRSPALHTDSLPAEPQGKPKNTGVRSLSLLQRIFLTQESNRGLLHCRRILYQLSYQGSLKGALPGIKSLNILILHFQSPELGENKFWSFLLPSLQHWVGRKFIWVLPYDLTET